MRFRATGSRVSRLLLASLAGILALTALCALIIEYRVHRDAAIIFFSNALSTSIVPPVSIAGATYEVEAGHVRYVSGASVAPATALQVLEIAYAVVLSRHNPIFAVDGTDPESLSEATLALKATIPDIADRYEGEERDDIAKGLYPTDFLSSLADLQQKRDSFLAAPSQSKLMAYRDALSHTTALYQEDLDTFNDVMTDMLPYSGSFSFTDGLIDRKTYLSIVSLAQHSFMRQSPRVKNFILCTDGVTKDCEGLGFPAAPSAAQKTDPHVQREAIDESIFTSAGLLAPQTQMPDTVLLSDDPCVPGAPSLYAVRTSDTEGIQAVPLQDIYFWDFSKVSNDNEYVQPFLSEGVRYFFQSPSNPYVCWGGANDLVRIASMIKIRDLIAEKPIFNPPRPGDPVPAQDAGALERRIVAPDTLSESDIADYAQDINTYLSVYGENAFAQRFGTEDLFRAEEILSIWENRSGDFDAIVRALVRFNEIAAASSGNPPLPASQIIASRAMFRLTFLFDDRSVSAFRLDISGKGDFSSGRLVSFWQDLSPTVSRSEAIQLIRRSIATYQEGPQGAGSK